MNEMQRIRNTLGIMGMLLPITLLFFNNVFGQDVNPSGVMTSISATWYSIAAPFFICLVSGVGFFLFFYKGYDIRDRVLCFIAGIGALGLVFFPCILSGVELRNFLNVPAGVSNILHFIFAFTFFAALIYIIGFQFTKTKGIYTRKKRNRNILYIICAALMFFALLLGGLGSFFFDWTDGLFWGESIALWAFGIAWLTKGGVILKDL